MSNVIHYLRIFYPTYIRPEIKWMVELGHSGLMGLLSVLAYVKHVRFS